MQSKRYVHIGLWLSALLVTMTPLGATAEDEYTNLSEELVSMRSEVEALHGRLEDLKRSHKGTMASLSQRQADLEYKRQQQDLRIKELETALEKQRAATRQAGVSDEDLTAAVKRAAAEFQGQIAAGLPFKVADRTAAVDELIAKMDKGVYTPHKAANRLWGIYEDELRMTRENGLYTQTVELGGDEVLARVARVGMVMMFFETPAGEYGKVVADGSGWRYQTVHGESREQVATLFDALEKQIRTGYFELPNTLPVTGG